MPPNANEVLLLHGTTEDKAMSNVQEVYIIRTITINITAAEGPMPAHGSGDTLHAGKIS